MSAERKQQRAPRNRKRVPHIAGYTSEAQTADELGVGLRTLRKWRQLRVGPPFVKISRHVFYPNEPRAQWLRARIVNPIREQVAA